ncbi:hypothetical protein P3T37_006798 [Kitasatospora sp. MAA4]|uniref:hypothetical protein n=1 Tax=Kitasatospora sp. MAA4 TaxID=3035093 RepID=UPI002473D2D6|nr:hypothetical protein [Kitasatospora sp. MAA4]MDH6137366.1 hypothetical protein [Kitasatospora sp. MAA4]
MTSELNRHLRDQRERADRALTRLRAALGLAELVLPSLGPDHQSALTGVVLIELGAVRPDIAERLADLITRGSGHADY